MVAPVVAACASACCNNGDGAPGFWRHVVVHDLQHVPVRTGPLTVGAAA